MTPPDALATRPERGVCRRQQAAGDARRGTAHRPSRSARTLVEIPVDLHRVAQGTDDLSRRFLARHDSAVPAHGDDHSPLAGDLHGLGPVDAGQCQRQVPLSRNDRLPAPDQHQPHVFQHAGPGRRDRPRDPRRDDEALPDPAHRHDRLSARLSRCTQNDLHHHVIHPVCLAVFSLPRLSSTGFPTP